MSQSRSLPVDTIRPTPVSEPSPSKSDTPGLTHYQRGYNFDVVENEDEAWVVRPATEDLDEEWTDDSSRDWIQLMTPEGDEQIVFHQNDTLYQREVHEIQPGKRVVGYTIYKIRTFYCSNETGERWMVLDRVPAEGNSVRVGEWTLASSRGRRYKKNPVVSVSEVASSMKNPKSREWSRTPFSKIKSSESGECDTVESARDDLTEIPSPDSCNDMDVELFVGEGSYSVVNQYMTGGPDGLVEHSLGKCSGFFKGAVSATYKGYIMGMVVFAQHPNNDAANRGDAYISRIACHPSRPKNTTSWLLSRARKWISQQDPGEKADVDEYKRIVTHSGVSEERACEWCDNHDYDFGDLSRKQVGNETGMTYKAAAFESDAVELADGGQWAKSKGGGRSEIEGGGKWLRQRWVYDL